MKNQTTTTTTSTPARLTATTTLFMARQEIAFKDVKLQKLSLEMAEIGAAMLRNNLRAAVILETVEKEKCYTKDGFSSMPDWAEKVFGIKKTAAYNMVKVARQFMAGGSDKIELPTNGKSQWTYTQLVELMPLGGDRVRELAEKGEISSDMTAVELRKKYKEIKEAAMPTTEKTDPKTDPDDKEIKGVTVHGGSITSWKGSLNQYRAHINKAPSNKGIADERKCVGKDGADTMHIFVTGSGDVLVLYRSEDRYKKAVVDRLATMDTPTAANTDTGSDAKK